VGEELDEEEAPAAGFVVGRGAGLGCAAARVADLQAEEAALRRAFGADTDLAVVGGGGPQGVGDQLGEDQLRVGEDVLGDAPVAEGGTEYGAGPGDAAGAAGEAEGEFARTRVFCHDAP
jgi:hypothetical protein